MRSREDGIRVLFIWNDDPERAKVDVILDRKASSVVEHLLDGSTAGVPEFVDGHFAGLKSGEDVRIFELLP